MTETGIRTCEQDYAIDMLILATGFDALTGALTRIHIVAVEGQVLAEKWRAGPTNYMGSGLPNLFTITGPGSPSVLAYRPMVIEQHVELAADMIDFMKRNGIAALEAEPDHEASWTAHPWDLAAETLFPVAASW